MRTFTTTTPDSLTSFFGRARRSHFQLFDTPADLAAFADQPKHRAQYDRCFLANNFAGSERLMSIEAALAAFASGDLSGVAKSDALLARFNRDDLETASRCWRDDVTGPLPNVPAFIAGHPLAMRRRAPAESAFAPIAIVVDIGAHSKIKPSEIEQRGAAVLALVRALSNKRPVELWAGAGLDADNAQNASWTFCRIETAPLDLARAAFILTHPAAIRRVLWLAACAHGFQGRTPYNAGQKHANEATTRALIAPAFEHVLDLLILPRLSSLDGQSITDPAAWIDAQLAKFEPCLSA